MGKILRFIAAETGGESYRTSKVELDVELDSTSRLEYDLPTEIVLKQNGETRPPKNFVSLESAADSAASSGMQILSYFLDGTRRIYKVDEVAYKTGSRKLVYPIIAAQVVTGCCRRADKKLHAEHFVADVVLSLQTSAGTKDFFPRSSTKSTPATN